MKKCDICSRKMDTTSVYLPNFKRTIYVCTQCRHEYGPSDRGIAEAYELCNVVFGH